MAYGFFFRLGFFFRNGFWPRGYHIRIMRDLNERFKRLEKYD